MKPIEVFCLTGSPEFIDINWQYDIDDKKPYALIIECEEGSVESVERKVPAFWLDGDRRD